MRFLVVKMVGYIIISEHKLSHSTPGYNHSGKLGQVDFLVGTMGIANAQRTLNYIRIITEFISQVSAPIALVTADYLNPL